MPCGEHNSVAPVIPANEVVPMKSGEAIAGTSHRGDTLVRRSSLGVPPGGADDGGGDSVAGRALYRIGGSANEDNAHEESDGDRPTKDRLATGIDDHSHSTSSHR